jgi:hypothetical protein
VYLFTGFKPPTNGHQLVPQQRHYPKSLKSGPRFSSTRKWRNTFSYKKASGAYSKDGIKLKKFIYNDKNGIHPLTPKSDYGTGITNRYMAISTIFKLNPVSKNYSVLDRLHELTIITFR